MKNYNISNNNVLRHYNNPINIEDTLYLFLSHLLYFVESEEKSVFLFKSLEISINAQKIILKHSHIVKPLIKLLNDNKSYNALLNIYFILKEEPLNLLRYVKDNKKLEDKKDIDINTNKIMNKDTNDDIEYNTITIYEHTKEFTKKKPKDKVGQLIVVDKEDKIKQGNDYFVFNKKYIIKTDTTPQSIFCNIENKDTKTKIVAIVSDGSPRFLEIIKLDRLSFDEDSKAKKNNKKKYNN
ncbi:hypothetical protein SLOPH_741 [Spraguea lophii 42_110]|uniref:Uncharacterized protein n=1 Tax=Spraguea lophii (strain 42_110) TaxID=1358809 RepID=S7XW65_SPRLO|nr:hypothetical protein SLOPH_741 [Spraguea lophii 42_110]